MVRQSKKPVSRAKMPAMPAKKLIVEGYVTTAVNLVSDTLVRETLWKRIRSAI